MILGGPGMLGLVHALQHKQKNEEKVKKIMKESMETSTTTRKKNISNISFRPNNKGII